MSTTWRAGFTALLFGLAIPLAGAGAAEAADAQSPDPGDKRGAEVVKAGWWWLANEPPPETGILAAPQPPTPTTPKGAIPVGAVNGDPEKVSALEVRLKAETGSTVKSFEMVLRESEEPGANANVEAAKVLACPVTELFWADGSAAAWKDQPTYDCKEASAKGKRTKKGLWRFDLTDIAAGWLEEGNADSRSVVLVEDVDAPESFQLALVGPKDKGVGLALKATPPPADAADDEALPDSGSSGSGGSGVSTGGGGSSLGSSGGGSGLGGPALAPVDDGAAPQAGEQPAAAADESQGALDAAPMAATPAWHSGIPRTAFLMAPLALGLAYLIMLALGPGGVPAPATGRHGVSRALDRLRQTGRDLRAGR